MKLAELLKKVLEGEALATRIWEETLKELMPEYPPDPNNPINAMDVYNEALRRYENALRGKAG